MTCAVQAKAKAVMRLICGFMQLDGKAASRDLLRGMIAQMDVPRLRPDLILWCEGPVGLAVLEFGSPGTAANALPRDGGCVLAADVRLDEPDALAGMMNIKTGCAEDSLLLAALQCGAFGLDGVLGDFAFAQWDRGAERLLCGRDVFGVRPLYYVYRPGELFAFSSLPGALYGSGIVAKEIDEDALARRAARRLRHDDSLIVGVKRLPPAHVIEVSREGVLLKRYWQLDPAAVGRRQCSPEAAAREIRNLVAEAVRCRLPRSGKIGTQLSGGLDSSAIAVLTARQLREQDRRVSAFSFLDRRRNDIGLADESEYIDAVLQQESDIDWIPIRRTAGTPSDKNAIDAGTMRQVPENANDLHPQAEAQGISLMLSGWGGDEGASFNGRGVLAELFLRGRWYLLAQEVSALSRQRCCSRRSIMRNEVISYLWGSLPTAKLSSLLKRTIGKQSDLGTLFDRSLSSPARRRIAASGDAQIAMVADARQNRWRLLTSPHIDERLEGDAQIGARHGIAWAFPLLDRRVVEFVLSLPSELFVRGGFRRRLFRDAMADVLPARVRNEDRKLAPFPAMLIDTVARRDAFLTRIDGYENNEIIRRTLDLDWLRQQVEAFPTVDEVREDLRAGRRPTAGPTIGAAKRALLVAAYLEQHGGK